MPQSRWVVSGGARPTQPVPAEVQVANLLIMMSFSATSKVLAVIAAAAVALAPIAWDTPAQALSCSLTTDPDASGTPGDAENPWLVGNDEDFQKIGRSGCSISGHYKQTEDIILVSGNADRVPTGFSGSYDGDFHTLTLAGAWADGTIPGAHGVFSTNLSGTIKKLHLAGAFQPGTSPHGAPLTYWVRSGGVISQVSSTVDVRVVGESDTVKISGLVVALPRGALIEYSRASGTLSWEPVDPTSSSTRNLSHYYGGLVVDAGADLDSLVLSGSRTTEIRDSYSRVTVKWPSEVRCRAYFGGIVGSTVTTGGDIYLVRNYSAARLHPDTDSSATGCPGGLLVPAIGGLVGRSDASRGLGFPATDNPSHLYMVSSFWAKDLIGNVSDSVGHPKAGSTGQYVGGLPRAVGLTSGYLTSIRTFQSRESGSTGIPDVTSNLAVGASTGGYTTTGTLNTNEATFRWAIEQGDQSVFVPSAYNDYTPGAGESPPPPLTAFFTRAVMTDPSVPPLGRVWEICSSENDGFPVLIWEDRNCVGGGDDDAGANVGGEDSAGGLHGDVESDSLALLTGDDAAGSQTLAATGQGWSAGLLLFASGIALLGVVILWTRKRWSVSTRL